MPLQAIKSVIAEHDFQGCLLTGVMSGFSAPSCMMRECLVPPSISSKAFAQKFKKSKDKSKGYN